MHPAYHLGIPRRVVDTIPPEFVHNRRHISSFATQSTHSTLDFVPWWRHRRSVVRQNPHSGRHVHSQSNPRTAKSYLSSQAVRAPCGQFQPLCETMGDSCGDCGNRKAHTIWPVASAYLAVFPLLSDSSKIVKLWILSSHHACHKAANRQTRPNSAINGGHKTQHIRDQSYTTNSQALLALASQSVLRAEFFAGQSLSKHHTYRVSFATVREKRHDEKCAKNSTCTHSACDHESRRMPPPII